MEVAWPCGREAVLVTLVLMGLAGGAVAQEYPRLGKVERLDPRLDALVPEGAQIEVLASGFAWAEGPIWIPDEGGALLFSDVPRNQILRWSEGEGLSVYLEPSGFTGRGEYSGEPGSNGLTLDSRGNLVACEHGDRRVSLLVPGQGKRTLVDSYQGRRLNSPNDLVYDSRGALYFTDPPYGLPQRAEDPSRELDHFGVYRLAPGGELTLLTAAMSRPNGIALSPDEKTLYVANSDPEHAVWMAFALSAEGEIDEGRVFFDATARVGKQPGLPDGLKVDREGNLFATGPGGVLVLAPDATHLGTIRPGHATANCAFGGDGSVLYLTADSYLARIQLATRGSRWPEAAP
jgi:gluconolactonase